MTASRPSAALLALLGVVTLTGIIVGRAATSSRTELELATNYRQSGELARATEHYRRCLRWSFSFGRARGEAVAGLEALAAELEASGDRAAALLAWRSLVGGVAASRFMYSGEDPAVEHAKDEISRLLALEGGAPIDANLGAERLAADHRRLLDRQVSPHPLWGTILLLGFAFWLGSLVLLINRGFDRTGKPSWPAIRGPLSGALVGLVSFVVGLLFA